MVGLALLESGTAQHASSVTDHQCQELSPGRMAAKTTQPQGPPVGPFEQQRQVAGRRIAGHQLIADRAAPDLTGRAPIVAAGEVADPNGDDHRWPTAGASITPGEEVERGIESALRKRHVVGRRSIPPTGVSIGGIGLSVEERPDPIDQCVGPLDTDTGQRRIGSRCRDRVATDPPSTHLRLVSCVGVVGRGPLLHVLLNHPSRLIRIEATHQIQKVGGDLPCRFVGRLRDGIDPVAAHTALRGPLGQATIRRQSRSPTGITTHRPARATASRTAGRQMSPSPPAVRPDVATRTGQSTHGQQPGSLQSLLPHRRQPHKTAVAESGQVPAQRIESSRQLRNGIPTDAVRVVDTVDQAITLTAGAPAGHIQHLHTINTKQPL